MTDKDLTQSQGRMLLEKLAGDEAFRTLFQTSPARALRSLGIDAETIVQLPAKCLCGCNEIEAKEHFADLLKNCADDAVTSAMKMSLPKIGFNPA